ncbi:MAG: NAD-dependent dehydratase, partial [Bdellovibrionota bacterium]
KSDVERLWADNSKARDLFIWLPVYAGREGFKRGLGETVEWFTDGANLRSYKADIYNL